MRPTQVALGEMPGPQTYNPWWGFKAAKGAIKQKGLTQYTISPFKQRPSKHILQNYLFNGYRRLSEQAPYWIVPFAIGYGTYTWAKRYDTWLNSKEGHLATGGGGH